MIVIAFNQINKTHVLDNPETLVQGSKDTIEFMVYFGTFINDEFVVDTTIKDNADLSVGVIFTRPDGKKSWFLPLSPQLDGGFAGLITEWVLYFSGILKMRVQIHNLANDTVEAYTQVLLPIQEGTALGNEQWEFTQADYDNIMLLLNDYGHRIVANEGELLNHEGRIADIETTEIPRIDSDIEDLQTEKVDRAGDKMSGDLDMDNNNLENVAILKLKNGLTLASIKFDSTDLIVNIGGTDFKVPFKNRDNVFANNNAFAGNVVIGGNLTAQKDAYFSNKNIKSLAAGIYPTDAVNLDQLDTGIETHDDDALAHESLRMLIEALEQEIARLDGKGKSWGMIDKTQSELMAMPMVERSAYVTDYLENKYPNYTRETGNLIYTKTVIGENEHEWEYNHDAGDWMDNGAWTVEKASNNEFGLIKGNAYVSIVAGLMQILLADNATYLKDEGSANKYTYQQIYDAITARYTKTEIDALLDQLKAVYGWESSALGVLDDDEYINWDIVEEFDLIVLSVYDTVDGAKQWVTQTFRPAVIGITDRIWLGLTYNATDYYKTYIQKVDTRLYFQVAAEATDARCVVTGIKMDGTVHNEMRSIGSEIITYRDDGKISSVVADTVTTTPTYDEYGNITKITEVYALDGKTYETTFTYDKFGRISATNKVEV